MPDVQNSDRVAVDDAIKYLERIMNERQHAHAGTLFDTRRAFRRIADLLDNFPDAQLKRRRDRSAKFVAALRLYLA